MQPALRETMISHTSCLPILLGPAFPALVHVVLPLHHSKLDRPCSLMQAHERVAWRLQQIVILAPAYANFPSRRGFLLPFVSRPVFSIGIPSKDPFCIAA